jgi:glycosyltransferase involved in cell wall biosynthesis
VVIGQFAEERNAEGLAMVLAAMPAEHPARLTLVSGAGVHPCLGPFVDRGALRLRSGNGDAYPLYRSARATLVPARRVTGVKTTLLQAWAAGCPSVCFTASARSIGPFARGATIAVGGAADAAEALRRLHEDEALRRQLVSSATDVLREHFDPAARTTALHDLIRAVSADRAW